MKTWCFAENECSHLKMETFQSTGNSTTCLIFFFFFNYFPSTDALCLPRCDLIPADPSNDALQWLNHRVESFSNLPTPQLTFVGCLESFPCPHNPTTQTSQETKLSFSPSFFFFFQHRINSPSEYPPLTRLNGIAEKPKEKQSYWNRNNLGQNHLLLEDIKSSSKGIQELTCKTHDYKKNQHIIF